MRRIRWALDAVKDLENIAERIREASRSNSARVAREIYLRVGKLKEYPFLGRPGRFPESRELVLTPLPFIVVYRVRDEVIEVAHIYHGAQDWLK